MTLLHTDLHTKVQKRLKDYYVKNEDEKKNMVDELQSMYDKTEIGKRGDVLVPENSRDVSHVNRYDSPESYDIAYKWGSVDTVEKTRRMEVLKQGQYFDRLGSPYGRCTGVVGDDGACATTKKRSIPYHLKETDVTKEASYHLYKAKRDFTRANLLKAIDDMDVKIYSDEKKAKMRENLSRYYDAAKSKKYKGAEDSSIADGLRTGEIAPMFEETTGSTGGGWQRDMPFNMNELLELGMIEEIPKK